MKFLMKVNPDEIIIADSKENEIKDNTNYNKYIKEQNILKN